MAKYTLKNGGLNITTIHKGEIVTLAEGEEMTTDDPDLARELSRWKYVEVTGLPEPEPEPEATAWPISEDLPNLSKKELIAIALPLGVEVKSKMNKKKLREAIESARE